MYEKRSIGLESARRAAAATLAAVTRADRPIAVAIADENGELVYAERMDGATANDMLQAERKAYTAAFMARDTSGYRQQLLQDGRTLADWSDVLLTTLSGGLTIGERREVYGGIGVHGNGAERDEALARIGLEAAQQAAGKVSIQAISTISPTWWTSTSKPGRWAAIRRPGRHSATR